MFKNLSRDVPTKNLSKQARKDLLIGIKNLDSTRSDHLMRLIVEFYKTNISISFTIEDLIKEFSLKVDVCEKDTKIKTVSIDLDTLSRDLQWVLYRYITL